MSTAILTLDIINDICDPNGKIARYPDRIAAKGIIDIINKITSWGRKKGHLIIHVRVGFSAHYLDASRQSPLFKNAQTNQALAKDGWGGQFCDALQLETNDVRTSHQTPY